MAHRTALVTGASSGIGEAFAHVFAAHGFDVVITARREHRLRAVAEELERRYGRRVHVIAADLSARGGAAQVCDAVAAQGLVIDALVNNAGYGVPGAYMRSPWERHEAMLQLMVMAVSELTHRLLGGMIERRYGRIVNVASLAALVPAPGGHTLYAAVKAFAIRFSEALAQEVERHGVHVTALCPGFTRSEFHDVAGTRARVRRSVPEWMWMDAEAVAREGFDAVMIGRRLHVTGRVNRAIAMLARYLPGRLVDAVGHRAGHRYRET